MLSLTPKIYFSSPKTWSFPEFAVHVTGITSFLLSITIKDKNGIYIFPIALMNLVGC